MLTSWVEDHGSAVRNGSDDKRNRSDDESNSTRTELVGEHLESFGIWFTVKV